MKKSELRKIIREVIISEQLKSVRPRPGGNVNWEQLTLRDFKTYADKDETTAKAFFFVLEYLMSLWKLFNSWYYINYGDGQGINWQEGAIQEQRMDPPGDIMNMTIPQIVDKLNMVPEEEFRQKGIFGWLNRLKKFINDLQTNGCNPPASFWDCDPPWWP